jgi:Pectinacetylesterase
VILSRSARCRVDVGSYVCDWQCEWPFAAQLVCSVPLRRTDRQHHHTGLAASAFDVASFVEVFHVRARTSLLQQLGFLVLASSIGCSSTPAQPANNSPIPTGSVAGAKAAGTGAVGAISTAATGAGTSPPAGGVVSLPTGGTGSAVAGTGLTTAGSSGSAGSGLAGAGGGASGSGGASSGKLPPTTRNSKYESLAPTLGAALPRGETGKWTYTDIEGATSRDGSSAGFYYKYSATGNKNLLVYLVGGGVCPDKSFCNINPPNKSVSLTAEGIGAGIGNAFLAAPSPEAQDPTLARWQSGIFKNDPANPVKDWNMVFIPYVTGDVFFGSHPDGTVPGVDGKFQFVGKTNMQKFLARIVPTFADAEIALMAGSSAGGIGTLLNATYFADAFIDQGHGAHIFFLDDAGPFFEDQYLDVCIQKRYRDLFGLNDSFPKDCPDCTAADGGLAAAILHYLADKYPAQVLGGLVDSNEDEIMKFFFSEALNKCGYIDNPIGGLLAYPAGDYPKALAGLIKLMPTDQVGTYIWEGTLHQNLFQTDSGDRFYEKNGLDLSVAEWLSHLLSGMPERIGIVK